MASAGIWVSSGTTFLSRLISIISRRRNLGESHAFRLVKQVAQQGRSERATEAYFSLVCRGNERRENAAGELFHQPVFSTRRRDGNSRTPAPLLGSQREAA